MARDLDETSIGRILGAVEAVARCDFRQYRREPLRRRMSWRMASTGAATADDYLALLASDPLESRRLVSALLVKSTSAFRDPLAFDALRAELPELLARRKAEGAAMIRAWVPACSTGPEAFSLGICLVGIPIFGVTLAVFGM